MSVPDSNANEPNADQKIFKSTKNIYAECGFFDDDPTILDLNSRLMNIDLNFDEPLTGPQIPKMHPLDKTTNRRKGKAIVRPARKDKIRSNSKKVVSSTCPSREDKTHFPFLSLPGEIRNQIYSELFSGATIYFQSLADRGKLCGLPFNLHLGITAVCQLINTESKSKLFENLTVVLAPVSGIIIPPPRIPRSVLDRLQYLTIMSYNHEWIHDNYLEQEQFPSLKSLVFRSNTTCVQSEIFLPDFAQNREKYLADSMTRRVDNVKQRVTKQGWGLFDDWFTKLIERNGRTFDIVLEHELAMGTSVTEFAQDAQHLSQVLLVSASSSQPNAVQKRWMTAAQYAARHECYLRMEEKRLDEPVAGRLPNKYQATKKRLKYMQYWERMNKFDVITKTLEAKALAKSMESCETTQSSTHGAAPASTPVDVTGIVEAPEDGSPINSQEVKT